MKRFFLSVFLMTVLAAGAFSQDSLDQRVAIVNYSKTENITRKQLDNTMEVLKRSGIDKSEQEVLEVMVEDVLLRQGAEKEGIQVSEAEVLSMVRKELGAEPNVPDDKIKEFIAQRMGVSWNVYADKIKTTMAMQSFVRKVKGTKLANIPAPTQDEIRRFYDENTKQFFLPKSVKLDHIYVDTRSLNTADAQKARERIDGYSKQIGSKSSEFDKLVEFSDDSASKYNNGRFGTIRIDDARQRKFMGDEFFDKVFAMKKGEISPVIKSTVGFHIVRVVDVMEPRLLDINEKLSEEQNVTVRDRISQYLTEKKKDVVFKDCVKELTNELKKKASIKYFL